ncbi:hypothetical protein [Sorangium sp. So ce1151]|uniref:hypothetical protein n=1 Tax=Sorangium sp. So ce1151 TaxID=3133332 RepID=UPI003F62C31E
MSEPLMAARGISAGWRLEAPNERHQAFFDELRRLAQGFQPKSMLELEPRRMNGGQQP